MKTIELWTVKFDATGEPHIGIRRYRTLKGALMGLRACTWADSALIA